MSELDTLRTLVRYNRFVFDRFERALERRGWKAASAHQETGHSSLKDTLVHILNVQEAWLVAIPGRRWDVFEEAGRQPASIRSWAELRSYRNRVWAAVDRSLARLTDRDLRRRIRAPWMPGRYTVLDGILQATFEEAHHLGEVIAVFWQNDWRPPEMTWIENLPRRRG